MPGSKLLCIGGFWKATSAELTPQQLYACMAAHGVAQQFDILWHFGMHIVGTLEVLSNLTMC